MKTSNGEIALVPIRQAYIRNPSVHLFIRRSFSTVAVRILINRLNHKLSRISGFAACFILSLSEKNPTMRMMMSGLK